jgi:hypothetical protein
VSLIGSPVLANEGVPKAIHGQSYFHHCEGLLEAISQEKVEEFFMGQVQSQEQALRLLADYGIIFTKEFREALLLTLDQRGIKRPELHVTDSVYLGVVDHPSFYDDDDDRKAAIRQIYKDFAHGLVRVAQLPELEFKSFVREVLVNLRRSIDTTEKVDPNLELKSKIVTNFIAAITTIENQYVEPTLNLFIRTAILDLVRGPMMEGAYTGRDYSDDTGLTGVWVLAGGVLGLALSVVLVLGTEADNPGIGMLTLIGTSGGGGILGGVYGARRLGIHDRRMAPLRALRNNLQFHVAMDDGTAVSTVRNLLEDYEQTSIALGVTMDQVCQTGNICKFSPVQLAYLGHLDMLHMEAVSDFVGFSLSSVHLDDRFRQIRSATENLRANPGDYRAQLSFRQVVVTTQEQFAASETAIREALPQLAEHVERGKQQIAGLKKSLFQFPSAQYSEDLINKNQILRAKLQTDLQTLVDVQTNQEKILARIEALRPQLDRLSEFVLGADHSDADWKKSAGDMLVFLDQTQP